MAIKRRLTGIRLDKIAAVDRPCQQHATVAIIKRAPDGSPHAIAKVTFQEALDGQLVASRVSEAFWGAFDGLWQRNDAFRTALTDELRTVATAAKQAPPTSTRLNRSRRPPWPARARTVASPPMKNSPRLSMTWPWPGCSKRRLPP